MKNFVQKILDPVLVQQLADSAGQVAGCSAVVAAMLGGEGSKVNNDLWPTNGSTIYSQMALTIMINEKS